MRGFKALSLLLALLGVTACSQSVDEGLSDGGVQLEIRYAGESHRVDLGLLVEGSPEGDLRVPLSQVVAATWPDLVLDHLLVDFAAGDGFRPASRSNCVNLIPLDGAVLEQGFVHALTGNLTWEEELGFPGCLQMSGLASVLLSDAGSQGRALRFLLGEQELALDLAYQPTETVEGHEQVSLAAVVAASGISESPELYGYDFEGSDGYRPTVDGGEEALAFEVLSAGWIDPASGDLTWDASLELAGAWSVGDCVAVHLLPASLPAASVTVVYGEQSVEVDLGLSATETVAGEELVPVDAIVVAAGLVADPALVAYDFEGADGFRPTVDRQAEALPFSALESGWMHPVSRNLSWDAALNLSGWWSVADVARIHLLDP